ncbi:probable uridine nucleosidase 2 [Caerostris darwini]|uniref:Probable uridine nucleosidase 2 n=1 Tax=Caerostris darwini TaxID=1538125 RepID=A0AAV4Q522_9ARAC|nr:probable uridine nucleosidase 2 [Caerostris darwini]
MSHKEDTRHLMVIDTDCGSDDAMAIMTALGPSGRRTHRLLAITCCFGNTTLDHVCLNVFRVLHVCQETGVPVYRGSSVPLLTDKVRPEIVHGSDGFGECGHLFPTGEGVLEITPAPAALVALSKKHPSITLVALGPLTNVALAHRLDPEFTGRLSKIVILGGNYKGVGNTTDTAEFNFYCDPEAANIVLTESQCPVHIVPWETVMEYGIDWVEFEAMLAPPTPKARLLKSATAIVTEECHKEGYCQFLDCDVLATVAALRPDCVTTSLRRAASVECDGRLTRGMVVCRKHVPGETEVNIAVNFDESILNNLRKEMVMESTPENWLV